MDVNPAALSDNIDRTKHIHATAQAAGKNKTSLSIVMLYYEKDGSNAYEETKTFILPDENSRLNNFTDSVYSSFNVPSNIDKTTFRQKIVEYSINIATKSPDYAQVNQYYEAITNTEDIQDSIVIDESTKNAIIEEEVARIQNKKQENLSLYEDSFTTDAADFSREPGDIDYLGPEAEIVNPDEFSAIFNTPENDFKNEQIALFGDKPTEGGNRPVVDMSGMSFTKTEVFANLPDSSVAAIKGTLGSRLIEPVPEPIYYPGDAYIKSENNSGIICSRDEYYRLRGHTKSGAVYIYAGRKGAPASEFEDFANPDLVKEPQPNNLLSDSAYIYISQKADVDSLYKYKLARGTYSKTVGNLTKKGERETRLGISLAAIKADDVLIMSRTSGIRLVTGTDVKNSKGGDQNSTFGIDLIAGNDDGDLQPLVKGNNLVKYLSSLSDSVDDIRKVLYDFMNSQSKFNTVISNHTHFDQFGIFLGTAASNNPLAINGGKGLQSNELISAGATSLLETIRQQANTVNAILNKIGNDTNGLGRIGAYKILSEKNRTN